MSDDSIITKCPHCKSQFRVTQGQLKIANRQVRCGHCLSVFSATDNEKKPSHSANSSLIENSHANRSSRDVSHAAQNDTEDSNRDLTNDLPSQHEKQSYPPQQKQASNSSIEPKEPEQPLNARTVEIRTAAEPDKPIPTLTIHREKIVLTAAPKAARKKNIFWFLMLIIALGGLAGQYLWFNRTQLYWNEPYQSIYQTVCQQLNCQLPPRFELDKIKNQRLIIRPHTEIEGAIMADLILLNSAPFEQPYPALRLTFSDLKGRAVASRTFQPKSYLTSEINISSFMPSNQPIQISLELMSPGTRAINYKVELLAPEH